MLYTGCGRLHHDYSVARVTPGNNWRLHAGPMRPTSARGRVDVVVTLGVRRDCSHQQRSHTKAGQFGRFGHLPSITGAAVTCHNAAPTGNHTSPVDGDNTRREPDAGWMLVRRRRRWTNIQPALGSRLVFDRDRPRHHEPRPRHVHTTSGVLTMRPSSQRTRNVTIAWPTASRGHHGNADYQPRQRPLPRAIKPIRSLVQIYFKLRITFMSLFVAVLHTFQKRT